MPSGDFRNPIYALNPEEKSDEEKAKERDDAERYISDDDALCESGGWGFD